MSEMSMNVDSSVIPIGEQGANNFLSSTVDGQFDDAPTSYNTSGTTYEDGRSNDPPGRKMNDLTSQCRRRDDVSTLLLQHRRCDSCHRNKDPPSPKTPPCFNYQEKNVEKGESSDLAKQWHRKRTDQASHLFCPAESGTDRRSQGFSTMEHFSGDASTRAPMEKWTSPEGQTGRSQLHERGAHSTEVPEEKDDSEKMKAKRAIRQTKKKPVKGTKLLRKRKTSPTVPSKSEAVSNYGNCFPSIKDYLCAAPIKVDTSDMDDVERLPMLPPVLVDKERKKPVEEKDFTAFDVLLGRGGRANGHDGNLMFRLLCSKYRIIYCTAPKGHKGSLARSLCNYVRQKGGRFLQKDQSNDLWYECGDQRAFAKCSQSLREGTAIMIRSVMQNERKNDSNREVHVVEETETDSTKEESNF